WHQDAHLAGHRNGAGRQRVRRGRHRGDQGLPPSDGCKQGPSARCTERGSTAASASGVESRQVAGGKTMTRILVPVGGTPNDRFGAQCVIQRFMSDTTTEVHLLNVQMPFSAYVARFTSRRSRQDYQRELAEKALSPVRALLDRHSIPYAVHVEVGDRARMIS